MENEVKEEIKQNKIKTWFQDPNNRILFAILLIGLVLRLIYFFVTKNQPLWWDEADYGSLAKYMAGQINLSSNASSIFLNPRRPFLIPVIFSIVFRFGLGEVGARIVQIIFSMVGVYLTYLLSKSMFNKKIGLIATFMMSTFWLHLFLTNRLLTGMPAATFSFAAIYFFWISYIKKESPNKLWLAGLFLGLAVFTRAASILIAIPFILMVLVQEGIKFIKNKRVWSLLGGFMLGLSPFIVWLTLKFDNPVKKFTGLGEGRFGLVRNPIMDYINFFPTYLQIPFFITFILGLIIFVDLVMGVDLIKKKQSLKRNLLLLVWILSYILFFGIANQSYMEPRYLIYVFPAIFMISSVGIMKIYGLIKKYNKNFAILAVVLILLAGAGMQINHANNVMVGKSTSYAEVQEAAYWMKENSEPNDILFTISHPQTTYYAERENFHYGDIPEEEFESALKEMKPKYLTISVFENHPEWIYNYPLENPDILTPVKAYVQEENPVLVIYQVNY